MKKIDVEEQFSILSEGAVDLIDSEEFLERLKSKKQLRIKIGFDPTAPDIHLGHLVQLKKLREFQDLGHQIIFLVGDFTAMIGDPSGKSETRPPLSRDEVKANADTYIGQVGKILDQDKLEIRYNSEWSDKLSPQDIVGLMSRYTVARLLEREDFSQRYKKGQAIAMHEFFYPLAQGYDSVALKADVELGGTDQTFNLLVGRKIQQDYGQSRQIVLTTELLVGTDGVKKMSKSLNNYVAILDKPKDKFGKIMSLSDDLMWDYWKILRLKSSQEITIMKRLVDSGDNNPRDIKLELAHKIVEMIDGKLDAKKAEEAFVSQFSRGQVPDDVPSFTLKSPPDGMPLAKLIKDTGLTPSTSEALRMINAGAVYLDEVKQSNVVIAKGTKALLRVGKRRYARFSLN